MAFSMKQLATDLAKENPHMPNLTLAKKMQRELKGAKTIEQCRSAVRTARGNNGKQNRKYAAVKKPNGKAGYVYPMPKSIAEDWTPLVIDKPGVYGITGDWHYPYHSVLALEKTFDYFQERKISGLVVNGDAWIVTVSAVIKKTRDTAT